MRILIVGSDANAWTISELLSKEKNVDVIFSTFDGTKKENNTQYINISETNINDLLDFVIANEIDLTIVTSLDAILADIGGLFKANGRAIFAPSYDSALITLYKSTAKRIMFKLNIPTVKFGIFDKKNLALDYISKNRHPLILKNDFHVMGEYPKLVMSYKSASEYLEDFFINNSTVVVEDYVNYEEYSMYFITDGYSAFYLGAVNSDDDFIVPVSVSSADDKISSELKDSILQEVIYPILDELNENSFQYTGILGVDVFINKEKYYINEFNPFFRQMHLQVILPLINSDLSDLFMACANSSLTDEYDFISLKDLSCCVSLINQSSLKRDFDEILSDGMNYYYTTKSNVIISQTSDNLPFAKKLLEENIQFLTTDAEVFKNKNKLLSKREKKTSAEKKRFLRKCISCNQIKEKKDLIRITKDTKTQKTDINNSNKIQGKSLYVCRDENCINTAFKRKRISKIVNKNEEEKIRKKIFSILYS